MLLLESQSSPAWVSQCTGHATWTTLSMCLSGLKVTHKIKLIFRPVSASPGSPATRRCCQLAAEVPFVCVTLSFLHKIIERQKNKQNRKQQARE